jgi:hypothetical protein
MGVPVVIAVTPVVTGKVHRGGGDGRKKQSQRSHGRNRVDGHKKTAGNKVAGGWLVNAAAVSVTCTGPDRAVLLWSL